MGDVNGIGPEILAKALSHRSIWDACNPVVIGNANVLRAQRTHAPGMPEPRSVSDPSQRSHVPGTVPVYDADVAELARGCLAELDAKAAEIRDVTPAGIDTVIDLFRREVEFCDGIGTSRPEEGSEHLVAYNMEHITRRHFIHGDLVALGIFMMTRLQQNEHERAVDLMDRLGLRYRCPDATPEEVRECLRTLKTFRENNDYFYSIIDTEAISEEFVEDAIGAWRR